MVSESERNEDVDGTTIFEKVVEKSGLVMTRFVARFSFVLGPQGEHSVRYDDESADPVEDAVQQVDANDEVVTQTPNTHKTFEFERLPCVPEYDAISEVPEVRSGDGRYDTPYNPRAIVRFTETAAADESAIDAAGLYSYSKPESGWVRIDKV
jgi:hypothetical protein